MFFQRLVPVFSLRALATSFIRLWRDHTVYKKIIYGATFRKIFRPPLQKSRENLKRLWHIIL
jgi:hypothetical protein